MSFLPHQIVNPLEDGIRWNNVFSFNFCSLHYFKHFNFYFLIIEVYLSILEKLENIDNPKESNLKSFKILLTRDSLVYTLPGSGVGVYVCVCIHIHGKYICGILM